jgi:uncharacterized protein (DUF58 family)
MPGTLRRLRSALDARAQAWIRRRQGVDHDPVRLDRRRIYILPTGLGLGYAAMVFAMVLGGLNFGNNLGLGLAFLLAGIGLAAMHHCHGNLVGLELRLAAAEPTFAGGQAVFRILLENRSVTIRPRLELACPSSSAAITDVPAAGSALAAVAAGASRRGRVRLERCTVATRHPLGLFRAWAVLHPAYETVAWPAPAARGRTPPGVEVDTGGAQDHARGEHDFAGLRPFQPGDSLRRIAWKTYARGLGLHAKQYAGTDVVAHVFDWNSLPDLGTEERLAQLCRWVLDAHESGEAFGLRLPGLEIAPNVGAGQRERCLNALALHEDAHASA